MEDDRPQWVRAVWKCVWCDQEQVACIPVQVIAQRAHWMPESPELTKLVQDAKEEAEQWACLEALNGNAPLVMNNPGEPAHCGCVIGSEFDATDMLAKWLLYHLAGLMTEDSEDEDRPSHTDQTARS